jgi:hypothetical protein
VNTPRLVPLSLKHRTAASRLRTHPHEREGLKRTTLNGTTSGCPPPSPHHNYRRFLHTQQRNHSETPRKARFWPGVAQITRKRDQAFSVSNCSATVFSISPFDAQVAGWAALRAGFRAGFPLPRLDWRESGHRKDVCVATIISEMSGKQVAPAKPRCSPIGTRWQFSGLARIIRQTSRPGLDQIQSCRSRFNSGRVAVGDLALIIVGR